MKCRDCKGEKDLVYCKDCYLKMQGWALSKIMDGDVNNQIVEMFREVKWDNEDTVNEIMNDIKEIKNALKDFKIRGFKLKSASN